MPEETTATTIENPNPAPGVEPAVSIPINQPAINQNLTAADPGHPSYDPLKSTRVKEYTDGLFSKMAQQDKELEGLKATIEGMKTNLSSFEKEKKEKEDAEKSDVQRANDQIVELKQNIATLEAQMTESKDSHSKEKISLNAKVLIMSELAKAGLKITTAEQRGLIDELEDKLKGMSDSDNAEEIANSIVVKHKQELDANFIAPTTPPPVRPPVKVEPTDIDKQVMELSRGTITAEDEAKIKALLAEKDRLQKM